MNFFPVASHLSFLEIFPSLFVTSKHFGLLFFFRWGGKQLSDSDEFAHKTYSEQTFENWWKLDLEKMTSEILMFLFFLPITIFFKKVAHDNSESFAPIFIWGWLFPGRFVIKNRFEERVILGPFLTILTFFPKSCQECISKFILHQKIRPSWLRSTVWARSAIFEPFWGVKFLDFLKVRENRVEDKNEFRLVLGSWNLLMHHRFEDSTRNFRAIPAVIVPRPRTLINGPKMDLIFF